MRPPDDAGKGKPPLAVGKAAAPDARYATVRADLDAIFAPVAPRRAPSPPPTHASRARDGAGRSGIRANGIVIALILACAAIGLAWLKRPAASIPTAASAPPRSIAAPAGNAAPTVPVAPADSDVAPVAPVPVPAAPVVRTASTAHRATATVAAPAGSIRRGHRAVRTPSSNATGRRDVATAAAPAACAPADSAWCLRGATLAADRDLRGAYAAAIRAKVKRRILVHIHHDWVKYRRLANKQPKDLIRGYDALTVDLHRVTSQKAGGRNAERGR